ncbi:MAG: alpha/beta hydrolase, partial [Dehalococcoidia bacterium]|nr:alpha/beta hydrolase [Dehalococcoidia bacterium]
MTAGEAGGRYLIDGEGPGRPTLVLAHGAGAPMDHPWMERVAGLLAGEGVRVVRFEFPYMAARRTTGKRPGPNPSRVLEASWREVIDELGAEGLVIG